MFGYATDETEELMPMPIQLAHRLTERLAAFRRSKEGSWVRPDGKAQVTVLYEDYLPIGVETVVVSTQHSEDISTKKLREAIISEVIEPVIPKELRDKTIKFHINPTGRFVIGGPQGDAGLTGRKIIVDTYGGMGRHGGGAFSGKDPSKVDRSACYAARWVAKNIVGAKLARRCEVQLAYAIGVAEPVSVNVDTFGTNTVPETAIMKAVMEVFDLTPKGHHQRARPEKADLQPYFLVRSLRPRAQEEWKGHAFHVGAARSSRRSQEGPTGKEGRCRKADRPAIFLLPHHVNLISCSSWKSK